VLKYLRGEADEVGARLRAAAGAEVVFNYLGQLDRAVASDSIWRVASESAGPTRHRQAVRHHQLNVTASILGGQLQLSWGYSRERYREETIKRVGQWQMESLRALIAHCRSAEAGGYTPSDFPLLRLSGEELEQVLKDRDKQDIRIPLSPSS
jgi:non-ribosomal peptide synthase protein (TIGR01720 family)